MADASTSAVFLDTSIQIARFVHGPNAKQRIRDCLSRFRFVATGLVVRQEFKRRLLREAKYLLEQTQSTWVFRPSSSSCLLKANFVHARKRNICLEVLSSVLTTKTMLR